MGCFSTRVLVLFERERERRDEPMLPSLDRPPPPPFMMRHILQESGPGRHRLRRLTMRQSTDRPGSPRRLRHLTMFSSTDRTGSPRLRHLTMFSAAAAIVGRIHHDDAETDASMAADADRDNDADIDAGAAVAAADGIVVYDKDVHADIDAVV